MSTGKAKQVLEAVMKAVEQDGECVFKLNEVDALIQKESVVDGKEAKKEEIVMKMASLVNVENMTVQQEMATHLEKMNVQHEKKMADLRKKLNDELSEDIECLIVQHVKKMADLRQKLNDEHEELSLERKKSVIGVMKLKPFGGGKQGRMMKGWQRDIYDALKNEGTIDGNGDYVLKAEAKKEEEKLCPRCIEEYDGEDGERVSGSKVVSSCEDCGVCEDCEHYLECMIGREASRQQDLADKALFEYNCGFPLDSFLIVDSKKDLNVVLVDGNSILIACTEPCTFMKAHDFHHIWLSPLKHGKSILDENHISCVEVPNTIVDDYVGSVLVLRLINTKLTKITVGDALRMLVDIKWNPHRGCPSFNRFQLKEDKDIGKYFEICFDK